MKRINDIFYSLQGEGRNTGRAAIFIRFAGCNLKCPFCDTDFAQYEEMSDEDILNRIKSYPSRFVVLTGGEPSLQVDRQLVDLLHKHDYELAMETNGTHPIVDGIDWITCSPKGNTQIKRCNELKCIFEENTQHPDDHGIIAEYKYLQPCDVQDAECNAQIVKRCFDYILQYPEWRMSLQTHKLVGFK
ncbi:7-carboxy-7-deazaguanine synthase QueE [Prevotella sp.]|uniref:7-carboxy-7-deazaguanine synthase QueE n=1 Tax=Prevotella sp. TaxID=59823 RepID=UPI0025F64052|nr:7-carboxy-7-deazaguanine synthase QueE [Prevotella sp.]